MPKGYTDVEAISLYLGKTADGVSTLTDDQQTEAETMLAVVEAYIDQQTRRAWLMPAQTAERHPLAAPWITVRYPPVAAVTAVLVRTTTIGETPLVLVAGRDYELQDPDTGYIQIQTAYRGPRTYALVDYLPDQPVPADIARAATLIAAHSLGMSLFPDRWGIETAQVDQRTKLQYTPTGVLVSVPDLAASIIANWRREIIT